MEPTYQDFLPAILASPDEDAARLILADWLEDQGHGLYASYIRTAVRAAWPILFRDPVLVSSLGFDTNPSLNVQTYRGLRVGDYIAAKVLSANSYEPKRGFAVVNSVSPSTAVSHVVGGSQLLAFGMRWADDPPTDYLESAQERSDLLMAAARMLEGLRAQHGNSLGCCQPWCGVLPVIFKPSRGFVEKVDASQQDWLLWGPLLVSEQPIRAVHLRGRMPENRGDIALWYRDTQSEERRTHWASMIVPRIYKHLRASIPRPAYMEGIAAKCYLSSEEAFADLNRAALQYARKAKPAKLQEVPNDTEVVHAAPDATARFESARTPT